MPSTADSDASKQPREWYVTNGMNITVGVGLVVAGRVLGLGPLVLSIFEGHEQAPWYLRWVADLFIGLFYEFFTAVVVLWVMGVYLLVRSVMMGGSHPTDRWWRVDVWVARGGSLLALVVVLGSLL